MTRSPTDNVVPFTKRSAQSEQQLSEDGTRDWTPEELRRLFHPTVNRLPFVARLDDGEGLCSFNYWSVQPSGSTSGDHHADYKRGKKYATQTIDALYVDGAGTRVLELIFESIVEDAVARRKKGGRYSRTNTMSVANGFLCGLSHFICAAVAVERQRAKRP